MDLNLNEIVITKVKKERVLLTVVTVAGGIIGLLLGIGKDFGSDQLHAVCGAGFIIILFGPYLLPLFSMLIGMSPGIILLLIVESRFTSRKGSDWSAYFGR